MPSTYGAIKPPPVNLIDYVIWYTGVLYPDYHVIDVYKLDLNLYVVKICRPSRGINLKLKIDVSNIIGLRRFST